jgi:hypothetical protein
MKYLPKTVLFSIDKVAEPLKNAEQLLKDGPYSQFLQLIHNNSVFQFNQQATQAQEGADQGAEVTQISIIYHTTGSAFPFNIHDELVGRWTQQYNGTSPWAIGTN